MYVNGKMRPVETIPGVGGGGIKKNHGGGEPNYNIRTAINITMHPHYNNNLKIKLKINLN
jgi:hypothetical protein